VIVSLSASSILSSLSCRRLFLLEHPFRAARAVSFAGPRPPGQWCNRRLDPLSTQRITNPADPCEISLESHEASLAANRARGTPGAAEISWRRARVWRPALLRTLRTRSSVSRVSVCLPLSLVVCRARRLTLKPISASSADPLIRQHQGSPAIARSRSQLASGVGPVRNPSNRT
jgi:hypothetical protein